jgi:hypothetical protein
MVPGTARRASMSNRSKGAEIDGELRDVLVELGVEHPGAEDLRAHALRTEPDLRELIEHAIALGQISAKGRKRQVLAPALRRALPGTGRAEIHHAAEGNRAEELVGVPRADVRHPLHERQGEGLAGRHAPKAPRLLAVVDAGALGLRADFLRVVRAAPQGHRRHDHGAKTRTETVFVDADDDHGAGLAGLGVDRRARRAQTRRHHRDGFGVAVDEDGVTPEGPGGLAEGPAPSKEI